MVQSVVVAPSFEVAALSAEPLAVGLDPIEKPFVDLAWIGRLPIVLAVRKQYLV